MEVRELKRELESCVTEIELALKDVPLRVAGESLELTSKLRDTIAKIG